MRNSISLLASTALIAASIVSTPALAKTRYAKTEVEKSIGKCLVTVAGGGILGFLIGGKKDRAKGAVLGAAAGGVACAVIMRNAKRKDNIIAAQRETAAHGASYRTVFQDDDGTDVTYSGTIQDSNMMESGKLIPVKYTAADGSTSYSPTLKTGGAECRTVSSSLSYASENSGLPGQVFCRTPTGDWEPYSAVAA